MGRGDTYRLSGRTSIGLPRGEAEAKAVTDRGKAAGRRPHQQELEKTSLLGYNEKRG